MQFFSKAVATVGVAAGIASAQQQSVCDKYTVALLKNNTAANQYTLLTLLVNTAGIGNFTGPGTTHPDLPGSMVNVPGILAPGVVNGESVNLLPYFSGALQSTNRNNAPAAVNFIDGGGAQAIIANPTSAGNPGSNQYMLFTHLYSYFGQLLGCSQYGQMGFPSYSGQPSQYNVHKYMNIDPNQNTWFIQQVGLAAQSFGVTQDDIQTVALSLTNAFNRRCSPATQLIPGQGAQLQSICVNSSCPLDPQSTCAAYPNNGAASQPAAASSAPLNGTAAGAGSGASSGSSSAASSGASSAASSGTGAGSASRSSGGGSSAGATSTGSSSPSAASGGSSAQFSGAAATNGLPAAFAAVAGVAAYLL